MSIDRVIHKNSMEHINAYRELLIVNLHGGRSSCSLRGGGAGPYEIFVLKQRQPSLWTECRFLPL